MNQSGRQHHGEGGAVFITADIHLAMMQLHDLFDNGQPHAVALGGMGFVRLIELLENAVPFFGRDGAADVRDSHPDTFRAGLDQYTSGDLIINGKSTRDFKDRDWDAYRNHSIPKPNGYRSLHLIVEVPIFLEHEKRMMKAEIHLRTIAMDSWAGLEHQLRYKKENAFDVEMADEIPVPDGLSPDQLKHNSPIFHPSFLF